MKNTEEKIHDVMVTKDPTVFNNGSKRVWYENGRVEEVQVPSFLSFVSDNIENTNDLCKVLLQLVGDFEDKFDRKVNLITFGPKYIDPRPIEVRRQRNIKIRWAETEEKIIQTKVVE